VTASRSVAFASMVTTSIDITSLARMSACYHR
jgi:hypothetical protein